MQRFMQIKKSFKFKNKKYLIELYKTIVIFQMKALEFYKNEVLANTGNLGAEYPFEKGS